MTVSINPSDAQLLESRKFGLAEIGGLTAAPPSLEQHEELVQCAERRVRRAHEKFAQAQAEVWAAEEALLQARSDRLAWIENNPDPQMEMPI